MIIELEKGDNLKRNCFNFKNFVIIKNNGERIKISWLSCLKLIDYRMVDVVKTYNYYDQYEWFVVNNHYKIDLEVVE